MLFQIYLGSTQWFVLDTTYAFLILLSMNAFIVNALIGSLHLDSVFDFWYSRADSKETTMVAVDSVSDDPCSNDTENTLDIEPVRLDKSTSTQSSIEAIETDVSL